MKLQARRTILIAAAWLACAWFVPAPGACADDQAPPPNTLTIANQSGDPVHAELIGPTAQVLNLENNESRTVNVAAGEYTMQIRYGTDPKAYTYSKVAPFTVEQTATTYMAATVTIDCPATAPCDATPSSSGCVRSAVPIP
jgi:hypothetical protein